MIALYQLAFPQVPGLFLTLIFPLKHFLSHLWQGHSMSSHLVIQQTSTEHLGSAKHEGYSSEQKQILYYPHFVSISITVVVFQSLSCV